ncbi:MAG: T9SS type A sorting domain-containing protein [Saprospiraceae bacterium]
MKSLKVICLLSCFPIFLYAQKFDHIWVLGNENQTFDTTYGGSLLDFNFRPPKPTYHFREHNMFTTNSSICDSTGNLLFYTNGCVIAGADDEVLENGDNINPGSSHTLWCMTYDDGYAGGPGNSVILPVPDSSGLFYLFHKRFVLFSNPTDAIFDKFYYTIVDMKQNGGKGKVIEKNTVLMSDTLARAEIVAVKHANGKDWWLVTPRRNSNQFYIFKFTGQGIVDTFQQTIGILPDPQGEGLGQMVFSPDGSKLYRTCRYKPVMVYSFDREAGVFTQFDTIHFEYGNQLVGEIGCAVSPNNRYLYLSCRKSLYQLDVFAPDISATQTKVAEWDGNANPFPTMFWACQLGPDCKIYINAGGDTRYYHVIHNPDDPGIACNVEQRGVKFQTPTGSSIPSFPNYRLGPIDNPGVPCMATVSVIQPISPIQSKPLWVYPNPTNGSVTIEYQGIDGINTHFLLFNTLGQMVKDVELPQGETSLQLPLNEFSEGMYWYVIPGASNTSGKLVISR